MAASGSGRGWWIAIPILLFFVITGLFWTVLDDENGPAREQGTDALLSSVQIISWNWNKTRAGDIFAVHGRVRNLSGSPLSQVVLELRTQDAGGQTLARHPITVTDLPAGKDKVFRADVPRTGQEDRGFLEVREVTP